MTESVEAPERIWIESDCGYMYFYLEEELADAEPPITEYVRADKLEKLAAENEHLRAEVAEWKARADDLAAALNNCIEFNKLEKT